MVVGNMANLGPRRKIVWDMMSKEYYSHEHRTSRNFDTIIHNYLPAIITRLRLNGLYLDLGGGRGRLKELCEDLRSVIVGDISLAMMRTGMDSPESEICVQMDALKMPFRENIYDGVFSLLGDPYSLYDTFKEVFRVLKPKGFFFITLPTKIWADNLRPFLGIAENRTIFKTQNGRTVKAPSFLYKPKDLKKILLKVGFKKVKTENWQPSGLISKNQFSRDVLISAGNLGVPPEELPLITYALAYKYKWRK